MVELLHVLQGQAFKQLVGGSLLRLKFCCEVQAGGRDVDGLGAPLLDARLGPKQRLIQVELRARS